jgi:hypothetical protein
MIGIFKCCLFAPRIIAEEEEEREKEEDDTIEEKQFERNGSA